MRRQRPVWVSAFLLAAFLLLNVSSIALADSGAVSSQKGRHVAEKATTRAEKGTTQRPVVDRVYHGLEWIGERLGRIQSGAGTLAHRVGNWWGNLPPLARQMVKAVLIGLVGGLLVAGIALLIGFGAPVLLVLAVCAVAGAVAGAFMAYALRNMSSKWKPLYYLLAGIVGGVLGLFLIAGWAGSTLAQMVAALRKIAFDKLKGNIVGLGKKTFWQFVGWLAWAHGWKIFDHDWQSLWTKKALIDSFKEALFGMFIGFLWERYFVLKGISQKMMQFPERVPGIRGWVLRVAMRTRLWLLSRRVWPWLERFSARWLATPALKVGAFFSRLPIVRWWVKENPVAKWLMGYVEALLKPRKWIDLFRKTTKKWFSALTAKGLKWFFRDPTQKPKPKSDPFWKQLLRWGYEQSRKAAREGWERVTGRRKRPDDGATVKPL